MRPLIVQVSEGKGDSVLEKAHKQEGKNISKWTATDNEKKHEVILAFISNSRVEQYIDDVSEIEGAQITLFPIGVMPLYPPQGQAPEQVTNVESRSPIEIFLAGLQSKGSWKGFISYAVIASIVVWIGLFTNTSFLLVAAMLIAPFAGPAMNTAISTARGDLPLMRSGLKRYFSAIGITILVTFLLSIILSQEAATSLMVDTSQISFTAVLLAVSAGAAGALNLVQSERESLVSGAAVGMLVAASLAPPTGVIGMALAIGEWQMVKSGVFLLFLQLIGINLSGSIIFKLYGLNHDGARYKRGKKNIFYYSLIVTVIIGIGLVSWQFSSKPELLRSSQSKRAEEQIQKTINSIDYIELVEANSRYTRADIKNQNTLLCNIYVQRKVGNTMDEAALKQEISTKVLRDLNERISNTTPVVNVVVLEVMK